jgi:hypothetical protein
VAGDDDQRAMENAKQLVGGHDVEVWGLARKVGTIKRKD